LTNIKAAAPIWVKVAAGTKGRCMRRLLFSFVIAVFGTASAFAAEDVGDPQAGFEYAQNYCSGCHGISAENSSVPKATRFREVADRPGMTGTALRVWIETFHPTMPNIVVEKQDMLNAVAYILSLKGRDADQR
jgi:mono/diheme cytochrome c family protein